VADYFIGDIQGCYAGLLASLAEVDFNPSKDTLWLTGDLVARGEDSLSTLKYLYNQQDSVKTVLGNHDLHLLAVANNIKKVNEKDRLGPLLKAKKLPKYLDWIRHQPLIQRLPQEAGYMSHAGLAPNMSIKKALKWDKKVRDNLASEDYVSFLPLMYGNRPNVWDKSLSDEEKLTFTISALTRMRYCYDDGTLDFVNKCAPDKASKAQGLMPWFEHQPERFDGMKWVFGHWASLMGKTGRSNIIGLDTGYVWGGQLSILHWQTGEIIKINNN
jgi:bis(5'-nucleosyl)-tetraphosphatase (symmetrical)